jgi:hypothetical protein
MDFSYFNFIILAIGAWLLAFGVPQREIQGFELRIKDSQKLIANSQ